MDKGTRVVGIDLGTTFSAIATLDEFGKPYLLENAEGSRLTPSVVYFSGNGVLVGEEAKEMQALGEESTAAFFKREMGNHEFSQEFSGREYNASDLSVFVLKKLKLDAEAQLKGDVSRAVITAPAYFNEFQLRATKEAGESAGFQILGILKEPTAAAIAFGVRPDVDGRPLLVYDLGGGTFDVTLLQVTDESINVLATDGDHKLGGKDWDDRIALFLAEKFLDEHGEDPLKNALSFNDLLVRCENGKKELSRREKTRISISHAGLKVNYDLTRSEFNDLTRDLLERTQNLCEDVLTTAGQSWRDLQGVLLVGGSTRMPMVVEWVETMSGKPVISGINADEAVAMGAAIFAAQEAGLPRGLRLRAAKQIRDVMSHSLGMVAENEDRTRYVNSIIIPKNRPVPHSESKDYQLNTGAGIDNELFVYMLQGESDDPTQCVILGKYVFTGVTHSPAGPAIINVKYSYDKNGMVQVEAVERSTGLNLPMHTEPPPEDPTWLSQPPEVEETYVYQEKAVVLCLDVSGSMSGAPLVEAQNAARAFIQKSDEHTQISLVSFGSDAKVECDLTQQAKILNKGIDGLQIRGSTAMHLGLTDSRQQIQRHLGPRFIVLFTDGVPDNQSKAEKIAAQICAEGIELITVGTRGADHAFLKKLACSDEGSYFARSGEVKGVFSKIAGIISEDSGRPKSHISTKGRGRLMSLFK